MKLLVLRMNLLVYITVTFLLTAGHFAAATIVTAVEGIIIKSTGDLPHLQSALLACRIEQNTTAFKTSWEFEGAPIDDMSSQFAGRTSIELSRLNASALVTVLHINRLSYRDSGVYTCKVEERTRTGRISASVTVTLQLQANGTEAEMGTRPTSVVGNETRTTTEDETTDTSSSTTEVPIILIASTLSGIVGMVIVLLIITMMCVIVLWRKQHTQKRGSSNADDTGTELRMKTQRGGTSLPTPAFPLQLQGSTRSTTSYYVNEGLGPISVNDGDQGNELSHEYESISANSIPMAANPAYQSTSYPMQQYFTGCHLGQEFRLCKHSQRRPHLT